MCTIFWIAPPQFATELFICAERMAIDKTTTSKICAMPKW